MRLIQKIFEEHWDDFVEEIGYKNIRQVCHDEVTKMIGCGKYENGYIEYECHHCGESKKVAFSCKSRLCSSCGKKYVDDRANNMANKMLPTKHWHMTFTIPKELRVVFRKDRELLGELPRLVNEVLRYAFKQMNKGEEYIPGVIAVIHTFGRDLKWNPHVHAIVTKGGVGKTRGFVKKKFISYPLLRLSWQRAVLNLIKKEYKNNRKMNNLANKLYAKYDKGFYVNANRDVTNKKLAAHYIGRYVGRPAISESRIKYYDGKTVTIGYESHKTKEYVEETMDVFELIKKIIIHIAEKQFKMIRYYGIYTNRNKRKMVLKFFRDGVKALKKQYEKWRYRIIKTYGYDPLECKNCGKIMSISDIYYPEYGSMLERYRRQAEAEYERSIKDLKQKVLATNFAMQENLKMYFE
jgi:hypothetical protein